MRSALLSVLLASVVACTAGPSTEPLPRFRDPPEDCRPWVRWWWPGNDVDEAELRREVQLLARNGFAGAEIQALNAALDPKAPETELSRRLSFDTDAYYAHVRVALEAAKSEGLAIDLTVGSGWPTGGTHVVPADSLKTLLWAERYVSGPGKAVLRLDAPDRPPFYELAEAAAGIGEPLARYEPSRARRIAVLAARVTGGKRDTDAFILTDQVELDPTSLRMLTDIVDGDGNLAWDVPEGEWVVIAFFIGPDGEFIQLAAFPDPGYVVDHFDAGRVVANLEHLMGARTGLTPYYGSPLRGFFNDSFEFKTERHVSDGILDEFRRLRGYELTPVLPAVLVPGADNSLFDGAGLVTASPFRLSDEDDRIQYDYQLTVSDLFIERFVRQASDWAAGRGLKSRVQPYGIRVDVLRAAGAADIPEAEQLYAGGSDAAVKAVASGAHLYGRNVVSAEALVWAGRDYMTTPVKLKAAADKLFTAGVNQLIFHGFPYRKLEGYSETGWHPFCSPFSGAGTYSSNVSEADPFWPWMPVINAYLSRVQYALRIGTPAADLLVYYPWLGVPASLMRVDEHAEDLFRGRLGDVEPPDAPNPLYDLLNGLFGPVDLSGSAGWIEHLWPVLSQLEDTGWTWEWVNDHALATARIENGEVAIGTARYRAILVADSPTMQPEAAEALARLARAGGAVVFAGTLPGRQPGWRDRAAGDRRVVDAVVQARAGARCRTVASARVAGEALSEAGLAPKLTVTGGVVRQIRRRLSEDAWLVFLRNPGRVPVGVRLVPDGSCKPSSWLDPWTGSAEVATGLHLDLPAYGSRFLLCGARVSATKPHGRGTLLERLTLENWTLDVTGPDVPGGRYQAAFSTLFDFRAIPELESTASPAVYETVFEASGGGQWLLDLGWVAGVARVRVNGQEAGEAIVPPWLVDITNRVVSGRNRLQITVIPPLRNRLIGRAISPEYREFEGDPRIEAGLIGPVAVERREANASQSE